MRTLGIDLSSKPERTAACVIDWSAPQAQVTTIKVGVSDELILDLRKDVDWVGIDVPFGWPDEFVAMVCLHHMGRLDPPPLLDELKKKLCYRLTDHRVHDLTKKLPLSVAADRIAIVAMRGIRILAKLGVSDRSGVDGVVEVYPAAALRRWCLIPAGFKGKKNGAAVADFVKTLQSKAPWLSLSAADPKLFAKDDHAFDALICALVARATALELTESPSAGELDIARREGWIALPYPDSLSKLPNGTPGH
ncbi:MAG: DUF429 domain-containing protein [Chloroflexota bacterium]|nr:DUF429 domain-containing protein [Chloroflexota bacterium]